MASRRAAAAAALLLVAAVVAAAAVGAGAEGEETTGDAGELDCFCDCMKNQCMTLGAAPNKFDCADACTQGCTQIGKPGQPSDKDFCGF
ncbi:hypothetical protein OsI_11471 [Oryza sativa Indica Group]|jgi:hypothetical protein|uniref:Bowman-Birk serine protease inhibitors family domain-containing protein n=2 Tax=Oryza TaxID=4527 RepID=A0A0E0GM36_ORYNI|nr:hypothetical protein OsI_11471 [Oryza sativa Indica Group]